MTNDEMVRRFIPNTRLPKGGSPLKRLLKKKIGGWVEMSFDATFVRHGIRWYRVKDGMGDNGDREDWVADLPESCISLHDYNWNRLWCDTVYYGDFETAVLTALKRELHHEREKIIELHDKIERLRMSVELVENSLRSAGIDLD